MMKVVENNVLVVPPFDCAWLSGAELQFSRPGKGCVAFEARAENDVTVIFKDSPGCKHYRTDCDPNYTVIIGSNLNKRLKIEANGVIVLDLVGAHVLLSPQSFERYWISVDDGLITVGRGDPGLNVLCRWVDPEPNHGVRFVGLSSWDKHVGYRNVSVTPPPVCFPSTTSATDAQWSMGLANYLESDSLADFRFVLPSERRTVPAHRVLLVAASSKGLGSSPFLESDELVLESVRYPVLHAALQYIYTGTTEVRCFFELKVLLPKLTRVRQVERVLVSELRSLAEILQVDPLEVQCRKFMEVENASSRVIRLVFRRPDDCERFSTQALPVNPSVLTRMLSNGEFSDLELVLEDDNVCFQLHRLVLSVWSAPFAKMFTSGMKESTKTTKVVIKDAQPEAFKAMIHFMYNGQLELEEKDTAGSVLLPLLILADRYAVYLLQQECQDHLLASVNEDSACPILQVASSMPSSETLRKACENTCAKHFDYCITVSASQFMELDVRTVMRILQHPELLVTSEEKVLDAVIMWVARVNEVHGWDDAEKVYKSGSELALADREEDLKSLLPLVRFPIMPMTLLQQLELSFLCDKLPFLREQVIEAMQYLLQEAIFSDAQKDSSRISKEGRLVRLPKNPLWYARRLSSFKELLYLSDGDCNGVLYYAGTSYGAHDWMNPVLIKQIAIASSSPPSRYTDPKALVSRNYQATCFTGPCTEDGKTISWWRVDLGASHQLMCNYYTVRQDGSTNFARTWSFQGSADGQAWTDLRCHEKDYTLCRPGQYASWPVHGAKSLIPFRYFRLLLVEPMEGVSSPWNFSICYLELYGYFH